MSPIRTQCGEGALQRFWGSPVPSPADRLL